MTTEADTLERTSRARAAYRILAVIVAVVAPVIVWVVTSMAGARLEVTSPLTGTLTIGRAAADPHAPARGAHGVAGGPERTPAHAARCALD